MRRERKARRGDAAGDHSPFHAYAGCGIEDDVRCDRVEEHALAGRERGRGDRGQVDDDLRARDRVLDIACITGIAAEGVDVDVLLDPGDVVRRREQDRDVPTGSREAADDVLAEATGCARNENAAGGHGTERHISDSSLQESAESAAKIRSLRK